MIIYRNKNTDAYFNLAAEQYLLDTKNDSIFMLWRNDKAVIIGKNQNAYGELDVDYVEKNNIKVVRRLTGGGAVFHDIGNVNFSFIVPGEEHAVLDFARFTAPIIQALSDLGIKDVELSGRNDIHIGGSKISGNAQSSYNGKTLHHGTLLYSADLSMLAGALRVDEEKIKAKGIKSVRNRVANIKDYLTADMSAEQFMSYLEEKIISTVGGEIRDFTAEDIEGISKLSKEKYSTWEWNFGQSKEYSATKKKRYTFGGVSAEMTVEKGYVKDIRISGDFFGVRDIKELEALLIGKRFEKSQLENIISREFISQCIAGMEPEDFISLLLS